MVRSAMISKTSSQEVSTAKKRKGLRGFTLVEMLVVLTIIGLIAGLVGPRVLGYVGDSREKSATLQINALQSALDLFYIDVGRYPTQAEGLKALVERPGNAPTWRGPYLKDGKVPNDPWGGTYEYSLAGPGGPVTITASQLGESATASQ